jgi:tRNA G18 (ribose-2'-O)-methylase SpoU
MNDPAFIAARPPASAAGGGRGLELLLHGLQSPVNIGMILRVAETYQFRVSIYDQPGVLDDAGKLRTIQDFACGAVERRGFRKVGDEPALTRLLHDRRLVATSIERGAVSLPDFAFRPGDVFALGNEYDGLPDAFVTRADVVLNIPMPAVWTPKPKSLNPIDPTRTATVARDGEPNLNVAMTAAIICYTAYAGWLASDAVRVSSRPAVTSSA